jgi:predicted MFS family arabinose efflux permease
VKIPHISPIALVLLIGGLGLTVGGIAGGVIGARRLRTR